MPRLVRILLALLLVAAVAPSGVVAQPATPVPDPSGPAPEECRIEPRSLDELRALVDEVQASGVRAATTAAPAGTPTFPTVELPEGEPADGATVAAVTETARQLYACFNAGDAVRFLSAFTDAEIRDNDFLIRLATLAVNGELPAKPEPLEPGQRRHFTRLHHARVLADGRVAAIAMSDFLVVPELYSFVRVGDRWLVDEITPHLDPDGARGVIGNTYTAARRQLDRDRGSYSYSYGIEWSSNWQVMVEPQLGFEWVDLALTNGTSVVIFGGTLGDPDAGLATCVAPDFPNPGADLWKLDLDPDYFDRNTIALAVDTNGQALRGEGGHRAFAVYDIDYYPTGPSSDAGRTSEPYRLYLECRAMAGGAWVLGITQLVPAAAYDAEVAARETLLATIDG